MISAGAAIARLAAVPRPDPPMPPRRLRPVIPLLVLGALACATDGPTTSSVALREAAEARVPITRFRAEPYPLTLSSGLVEPARAVVRDDALWRATWTAIWSNHWPEPALPAVDFAREMVVVAALGERASGGYAILVDSATVAGGALLVHLRTLSPGPRCYVTAALTQAVDAVRLPRHDGPVAFRERAEVVDCD